MTDAQSNTKDLQQDQQERPPDSPYPKQLLTEQEPEDGSLQDDLNKAEADNREDNGLTSNQEEALGTEQGSGAAQAASAKPAFSTDQKDLGFHEKVVSSLAGLADANHEITKEVEQEISQNPKDSGIFADQMQSLPYDDSKSTELKDKLLIFEQMDTDDKKESESPPLQSLNQGGYGSSNFITEGGKPEEQEEKAEKEKDELVQDLNLIDNPVAEDQHYEEQLDQQEELVHQEFSPQVLEDQINEMLDSKFKIENFEQLLVADTEVKEDIIRKLSASQIHNLVMFMKTKYPRACSQQKEFIEEEVEASAHETQLDETQQESAAAFVALLFSLRKELEGEFQNNVSEFFINESSPEHYEANTNLMDDDQPQEQNEEPKRFRAKLYRLDDKGRWIDLGTGNFSIEEEVDAFNPNEIRYRMSLLSESDLSDELLKDEYILPENRFDRQRRKLKPAQYNFIETIITWSNKKKRLDLAVSFQVNTGAQTMWAQICKITGDDPDQMNQESQGSQGDNQEVGLTIREETIPSILDQIKRQVISSDQKSKSEFAECFLENEAQNLEALGQVFNDLEKEQEIDRKKMDDLFQATKGLIQLNDGNLVQAMLSTRFYLQTFGALEWDPEGFSEEVGEGYNAENDYFMNTYGAEVEPEEPQPEATGANDLHQAPKKEAASPQTIGPFSKKKLFVDDQSVRVNEDEVSEEPKASQEEEIKEEEQVQQQQESQQVESSAQQSQSEQPSPEPSSQAPPAAEDEKAEEPVRFPTYNITNLNYREFLTQKVQFKQVVDFGAEQEELEERIHVTYRLHFLKDTVMARYIEDQSANFLMGQITQNNREIMKQVFGFKSSENVEFTSTQNRVDPGPSIKERVLEKIRNTSDVVGRHQAIEFMIDMCQILKTLQIPIVGGLNAGNYIQGAGGNSAITARAFYDQLSQVNLVGLLAETLSIFVPSIETLATQLGIADRVARQSKLYELYSSQAEPQAFEELTKSESGEPSRLDKMKMNSMEIIIHFQQQSIHSSAAGDANFLASSEGSSFLDQLVNHLQFSSEQGLKIQIADYLKHLFDREVNKPQFSQKTEKLLYDLVLARFVSFFVSLSQVLSEYGVADLAESHPLGRSLEYSVYLMMQILNRVTVEHKYPYSQFVERHSVIKVVADLHALKSKIINIEIVKFFKSMLKSKDHAYPQYLINEHLFYPIFNIFKATYHKKNPPMVQSCIRDLFDLIFKKVQQPNDNEYYNPKLDVYLTQTHQPSRDVIYSEEYADVFQRYQIFEEASNQGPELKNTQPQGDENGSLSSGSNDRGESPFDRFGRTDLQKGSRQVNFLLDRGRRRYLLSNRSLMGSGGGFGSQKRNHHLWDFRHEEEENRNFDNDDEEEEASKLCQSPTKGKTGGFHPSNSVIQQSPQFQTRKQQSGDDSSQQKVQSIKSFLNDLAEEEENDEDIANDLEGEFSKDQKFKPLFAHKQPVEQKEEPLKDPLEEEEDEDIDAQNQKSYEQLMQKRSELGALKKPSKEEVAAAPKPSIFKKINKAGADSGAHSQPCVADKIEVGFDRVSNSSSEHIEEGDLARDLGIFDQNKFTTTLNKHHLKPFWDREGSSSVGKSSAKDKLLHSDLLESRLKTDDAIVHPKERRFSFESKRSSARSEHKTPSQSPENQKSITEQQQPMKRSNSSDLPTKQVDNELKAQIDEAPKGDGEEKNIGDYLKDSLKDTLKDSLALTENQNRSAEKRLFNKDNEKAEKLVEVVKGTQSPGALLSSNQPESEAPESVSSVSKISEYAPPPTSDKIDGPEEEAAIDALQQQRQQQQQQSPPKHRVGDKRPLEEPCEEDEQQASPKRQKHE